MVPAVDSEELADKDPLDRTTGTDNIPPVMGQVDKVKKMPVGFRPEMPLTVESVMELSRSIQQSELQLIEREKVVAKDRDGVSAMFEDLEREREELVALSTQIDSKIRALREVLTQLKVENEKAESERQATAAEDNVASEATPNISDQMRDRVKIAKKLFATMDDQLVAKLLTQSANDGDFVFAGLVIKGMDERKGGKILAQIDDPLLAGELIKAAGINK